MTDFTELSRSDRLFFPLVGLYFYETVLDVEILQKALDETVEDIPLLSSVVRDRGEGKCVFEHIKPSNIQIKVNKVEEEDMFDAYHPNENGVVDIERYKPFSKHYETPEKIRFDKPKFDVPLVKITLIILNEKKSILAVAANHCIVDMHSIIYFMNRWSKGRQDCLVKNFQLSRNRLLDGITPDFDIEKVDPEISEKLQVYHKATARKEDVGMKVFPTTALVPYVIHFTPQRIAELKKLVTVKNKKFSSHDCVAAHLWKLFACLGNDKSQEIPLVMIMNFRNRVKGLDTSYFGNAAYSPGIFLTRNQVLDAEFKDLVFMIRSLIDDSDHDKMVDVMTNCFIKFESVKYTLYRKTTLIIDDWRIFDVLKPDFGDHKCVRGVFAPPGVDLVAMPTQFVFVGMHDDGGMVVRVFFTKEEYQKLEGFDLTDPQQIDKIDKLFALEKENEE